MSAAMAPHSDATPTNVSTANTAFTPSANAVFARITGETMRALRVRAAESGTTVRAVVLEVLRKGGIPVPSDELVDRRRKA